MKEERICEKRKDYAKFERMTLTEKKNGLLERRKHNVKEAGDDVREGTDM
jgi:hypothetical protein